jgi:hypothetical protein
MPDSYSATSLDPLNNPVVVMESIELWDNVFAPELNK